MSAPYLARCGTTVCPSALPAMPDARVQRLCAALPLANDRMEAGFFFEEGGCWGFALALHGYLTGLGLQPQIVYQTGWMHAYVFVDNIYLDYRGACVPGDIAGLVFASPDGLVKFAVAEAYHLPDEIESAKDFASRVIDLALEIDEPVDAFA